MSTITIST